MTSAPSVSARNTHRENGPTYSPNAAPGLNTSVKRTVSPSTGCGSCRGTSSDTATSFVATSSATTVANVPQNRRPLPLFLSIFLALLARDAVPRVWQRVETVKRDVLAALVAPAKRLRRPIQPAQGFIDMPQEPPFLAGEQERLLPLHGVRALVGHVERIRAQIAVRVLHRC